MNPKTALKILGVIALIIMAVLSFLYLKQKADIKRVQEAAVEQKELTPEEIRQEEIKKEVKKIDEEIEQIWQNNTNENGGLDISKQQEVEDLVNEKIIVENGKPSDEERKRLRAEREALEAEINAAISNSN